MTIKKTFSSFFIALIIFFMVLSSFGSTIFADDNIKDLGKGKIALEHIIYVNGDDQPIFDSEKTIEYKGKKYELVKTEYKKVKTEKPIFYTLNITVDDKEKLKKEITKKINGISYKLTAQEPNWKTKKENVITANKEYASVENVPSKITKQGKELELVDTKKGSKTERYSAPIYFYSASKNTRQFKFNGKVITLNGGSPTWAGHEKDIKRYLGENGTNYKVSSVFWSSGYLRNNAGGYMRRANVVGTKVVPLVTATFSNAASAKTIYTAKIKYLDSEYPDGKTKTIAICTYQKKRMDIQTLIKIGAGVAIIALVIAAILYYIRKKKSENE